MTSHLNDSCSSDVDIKRLPVNSEEHCFQNWTFHYKQSHILHSQCATPRVCQQLGRTKCSYCIYSEALVLPHMPDMVFPNNILTLTHSTGAQINFNALDALKAINNGHLPLSVACAKAWQETRTDTSTTGRAKPFDWTFSTDYKGTYSEHFRMEETDDRIDLEKLKEKEKIHFYHELTLYEDELHDNGIASCSVKIRVMPASYFILLRYFLRVDNVMIRVNDTRMYHEFDKNFILREYTSRESTTKDLNLPLNMYSDATIISPYLPISTFQYEKLSWN